MCLCILLPNSTRKTECRTMMLIKKQCFVCFFVFFFIFYFDSSLGAQGNDNLLVEK